MYKYGTIYRTAYHGPRLEFCQFVNITKNDNLAVFHLFEQIRAFDPKLIHNCPYTGLTVKNFTLREDVLPDTFPTGDYKIFTQYTDPKGKSMGNITIIASVKSSDPHSFG